MQWLYLDRIHAAESSSDEEAEPGQRRKLPELDNTLNKEEAMKIINEFASWKRGTPKPACFKTWRLIVGGGNHLLKAFLELCKDATVPTHLKEQLMRHRYCVWWSCNVEEAAQVSSRSLLFQKNSHDIGPPTAGLVPENFF